MFSLKRKQRDLETDWNCTTEVKRVKRYSEDFSNKLTLKDEQEINIPQQENNYTNEQQIVNNLEQLPESKLDPSGFQFNGYQYYEGFNQYLKVLHMDRMQRLGELGKNLSQDDRVRKQD